MRSTWDWSIGGEGFKTSGEGGVDRCVTSQDYHIMTTRWDGRWDGGEMGGGEA